MSTTIYKSIDIEDAIRKCLTKHLTVYCPPLPEKFSTPNILVRAVGGTTAATASGRGKIDAFTITLDSRADDEGSAQDYLATAIGLLESVDKNENGIAHIEVNSLYSWGSDPVRPDLAMCSAMLTATAHRKAVTIE